ncbi:MAG: alkaline phosphatase [Phycisphaerales bacterium]
MDDRKPIDRRSVLLAGTAAAAGVAAAPLGRVARAEAPIRPVRGRAEQPARARNLIFMVADGMSTGTLTLAHLARLRREGRASRWVETWSRPGVRRASATTHAADSLVTDSAAGGSAWGIGVKVYNGAINIDSKGRQWLPILPHARQQGKMTALVTTTRVTHATPASFAANVPHRDFEPAIAEQLLDRQVDLILGGGQKHFGEEMLSRHPAYRVARTSGELAAIGETPGPLLGIFAEDHLPYALDGAPGVPTLAELTRCALGRVSRAASAEGFVMQIEGGRVDHAAHANDAAALVNDQLAFDDCVGLVAEWTEGRDDTLVIVTSDHGNANPGLTLYGPRGDRAMDRLLKISASYERLEFLATERAAGAGGFAPAFLAALQEATGIELGPEERGMVLGSRRSERVAPFVEMNNWSSVLGQVMANHVGVSFISPNHTADVVEVTAWGPGSEKLPAFCDNTDLHGLAVRALDLAPGRLLEGMDRVIMPRRSRTGE